MIYEKLGSVRLSRKGPNYWLDSRSWRRTLIASPDLRRTAFAGYANPRFRRAASQGREGGGAHPTLVDLQEQGAEGERAPTACHSTWTRWTD